MVYIDINNRTPVIFIPAHGWEYVAVGLALSVKNTTDGSVMDMPIASSNRAGFLVCLSLQLPEDFYAGEWQYQLTGVGGDIASGLLMAFDGKKAPAVEYHSANQTIQYGG